MTTVRDHVMTKVRLQYHTGPNKRRKAKVSSARSSDNPRANVKILCPSVYILQFQLYHTSPIYLVRHSPSPKFESPQSRQLPYWYCVWSVNEGVYRKDIGSVEGIGGLREATGPCESRSEGEREGKRKGMVVVKMRRDRFSDDGLVIVNLDMYTSSWGIP